MKQLTFPQLNKFRSVLDLSMSLIPYVSEFLGFFATASTTGSDLANLIIKCLVQFGLDPNNLRGQGYDGACVDDIEVLKHCFNKNIR